MSKQTGGKDGQNKHSVTFQLQFDFFISNSVEMTHFTGNNS